MVPIFPKDDGLTKLPFGGAVLHSLDALDEEVSAILEDNSKEVLQSKVPNENENEEVLLQMGIILEKDIHDHDGNMSVVPEPAPAPTPLPSSPRRTTKTPPPPLMLSSWRAHPLR